MMTDTKVTTPTSKIQPSRRTFIGHTAYATIAALGAAGVLYSKAEAAEPNADADLIALCARHAVAYQEYNARPVPPSGTPDPLWDAYAETCDAITDAEPQTMAGLVAIARAAMIEGTDVTGEERERFFNGPDDEWAWLLVGHLLRLEGGAA